MPPLEGMTGETGTVGLTGKGLPTGMGGPAGLLLQHHPSKHPAWLSDAVENESIADIPAKNFRRAARFIGFRISNGR
jgi:hypothetical protein